VFQSLEHHVLAVAAKSQPNARAQYLRHRPEQTAPYQLIQQHAAPFFSQAQNATGSSLPRYVKDEFDSFLSCGILVHGFLRLHCGGCKQDQLLAFSCKRRG
jgi:Transposase zinc-binding domain